MVLAERRLGGLNRTSLGTCDCHLVGRGRPGSARPGCVWQSKIRSSPSRSCRQESHGSSSASVARPGPAGGSPGGAVLPLPALAVARYVLHRIAHLRARKGREHRWSSAIGLGDGRVRRPPRAQSASNAIRSPSRASTGSPDRLARSSCRPAPFRSATTSSAVKARRILRAADQFEVDAVVRDDEQPPGPRASRRARSAPLRRGERSTRQVRGRTPAARV